MLKKGEISRCLYENLLSRCQNLLVEDVRIGLGYAGIKLEGNMLGVAAVLRHEISAGCSTLDRAGTLRGLEASALLRYLIEGRHPLDKTIGLATANALINVTASDKEDDAIDLMNLSQQDRVAMVGLFKPLVLKIQATGAELSIIERDPNRIDVVDDKTRDEILANCTVAIITATALITDTLEEIINSLGNPRHVAILGPSTPLYGDVYRGTGITHLGGSAILDTEKVLQIISEGGGTPSMRPYLKFVNLLIQKNTH